MPGKSDEERAIVAIVRRPPVLHGDDGDGDGDGDGHGVDGLPSVDGLFIRWLIYKKMIGGRVFYT